MKTRVLSGEFGRPLEARLVACWARPASYFQRNDWAGRLLSPGGRVVLDSCMGNAMAHYVHNLLFWAGQDALHSWGELGTVQAELYRAHDIEGPDTVFVEAVTTGRMILRIGLTHACHAVNTQLETIVCELATLHYVVNSAAEIHWNDGRVETIPLSDFKELPANHLAYYRYLRGGTDRPASTLADSRPFVHLNNLAYISSNEISRLPDAVVRRIPSANGLDHYLDVRDLPQTLNHFTEIGLWPSRSKGWRVSSPAVVTQQALPRFHETVKHLASISAKLPSVAA